MRKWEEKDGRSEGWEGMERGGGRIKMEGEGEELRWRVRGRGGGTQLYKRPETLTQSAIMMFSRGP